MKPKKLHAFVIWEGASLLDGKPVVLLATKGTRSKANSKTGSLIQTYILRSDTDPVSATKTGEDLSICGECPHRKAKAGSCYVRVEQGPLNVYKAFKRGVYPRITLEQAREQCSGELVRLGAYGDPAAIPLEVWETLLKDAKGFTGYSHQWKTTEQGLARYCMASCDNVGEAIEAQAKGWRSFTVVSKDAYATRHGLPVVPHSFLCPASEEGGKKLTCAECLACGGNSSPNKASVYIPVHGVAFKQVRFNNLIQIGRVS
jgi:hypothetical protein